MGVVLELWCGSGTITDQSEDTMRLLDQRQSSVHLGRQNREPKKNAFEWEKSEKRMILALEEENATARDELEY